MISVLINMEKGDAKPVNPFMFHNCNQLEWSFNDKDVIKTILQCSSGIAENKHSTDALKNIYNTQEYLPFIDSIYYLQEKSIKIIKHAEETIQSIEQSNKTKQPICTTSIALIYHTISLIIKDIGSILEKLQFKYKIRYVDLIFAHVSSKPDITSHYVRAPH